MKKFMINTIEGSTNKVIRNTRLLYTFDKLSKINFFEYIGGFSNLILLVKTLQGRYIAAFSEDGFKKGGKIPTGKSLLFALRPAEG